MAYQVLARKWRPKSFEELIGQESTVIALKNALDQNRLHHAYLFNGTRGVGKTTLARILAKALDCEKGTSSQPCLKCNTCQEIDTGRYVDLVELDAASNTQVDNMRDLLENAQYAPSSGKFKIYIIDEVHMLSKSAFNAMLKTLEEPPEHVKFILATTEPNKVPITILSRCLQFDLKAMTQENISTHLESILDKEKIEFDKEATKIIAKAGAGSMRDALSLLDQALAFSGNRLDADKTHEMFGTINDEIIIKMLSYITNNNAEELLNLSNDICKKNISIENILNDLASLIHELSLSKFNKDILNTKKNKNELIKIVEQASPEQLQVLYQIVIHGKKDLYMAPDMTIGLNMTLLRMIAFYPSLKLDKSNNGNINFTKSEKKNEVLPDTNINKTEKLFDGDWRGLVNKLNLGIAKTLAKETEFVSFNDNVFNLLISSSNKHLVEENYKNKLEQVLSEYFSKKIRIDLNIEKVNSTPSIEIKKENKEILSKTKDSIVNDKFVQDLVSDFDGEIITSSIQPNKIVKG
ncbi:MAG: DNA polymerase III subunit gamma/tau [Methylophilaceae bacterium]